MPETVAETLRFKGVCKKLQSKMLKNPGETGLQYQILMKVVDDSFRPRNNKSETKAEESHPSSVVRFSRRLIRDSFQDWQFCRSRPAIELIRRFPDGRETEYVKSDDVAA